MFQTAPNSDNATQGPTVIQIPIRIITPKKMLSIFLKFYTGKPASLQGVFSLRIVLKGLYFQSHLQFPTPF